jgi:hypothetical protein
MVSPQHRSRLQPVTCCTTEKFTSITSEARYANFSLEELRVTHYEEGNHPLRTVLLKKKGAGAGKKAKINEVAIEQGPLLSGNIVAIHSGDLVPQYGLLGSLAEQDAMLPEAHIYSNPNTPFAAFICGVQGIGKSHTSACLLENSIIPSPYIGRLEEPVSCLVYSWADNSGSTSFNVSEAAYLGTSLPEYPGHRAKHVIVLYSPSNPVMRKHYERLPNVRAIPFYLNPKKLTISAMLTLMAVDESSKTPLYVTPFPMPNVIMR